MFAESIFYDSFEFANHDGEIPIGWTCDDDSWLCGYLEKDHNRKPQSGNWYAYTNADESWMFMELYMSTQLKYRFKTWAISDGKYDFEIWAGNSASSEGMSQLMLSATINSGNYFQYTNYVEDILANYQFFGIHAVAHEGAYYLSIDDIEIDMVEKYALQVSPDNIATNLMPGAQAEFHFDFINVGYEPLTVYITPISEYFTDIHLFANGVEGPTFPADPDEIVEISGVATLPADIAEGTLTWIDIMFTLDCGCATAMFTLWATAGTDSADEFMTYIGIYPNPSNGNITIEGSGTLKITDFTGQAILIKEIVEKEVVTLKKGLYFVSIDNKTQKIIVR